MVNEMRLMYVGVILEAIKTFRECYAASETELNQFIIETANTTLNMVESFIKKAPTVDAVEVVHGRWEMGVDEGDYDYGTCSVCGYNEYNAFCCLLPHNYCPNCGAKMDGGNEDGT